LGRAQRLERLERREIRLRLASSARIAARRGITRPEAGDRPRPDLAEGTDLLPQIRHIVILMMENHSYDNYLGMLTDRGEGFPPGPDGTPDVVNYTPDGRAYPARHMPSTTQVKNNPSQNWHASHIQFGDGSNDGFAAAVTKALPGADPSVPMGYWTEDDLPFYYGLARTFPLADRWFSSCLGPTFPNRRFLISGTAHGLIDDLPWDLVDYPEAGTIFDVLSKHGITWVNYHNVRHYSTLLRRVFGGRGLAAARRLAQVGRWLPGVADRAVGNKSFTADLYPLGLAGAVRHLRQTEQFFADADAGTLPGVSIVDPDFEVYSEENPQDIRRGEAFAAEVINRVMSGPAWSRTLLIWCYDENGGYYDHVPPPEAVPPDDVPAHNYILDLPRWLRRVLSPVFGGGFARLKAIDEGPRDYGRYGFRVPAVIVSPYARPDYVCSTTLDHTSVLKLIEEKWNLPPLTRRDAAARSPLDAVDLDGEPAFAEPPKLPEPALRWGSWGRRPRRRAAGLRWARELTRKSVRLAQRRTTQRRTARS
jgi:phospholipase C